MEPRIQVDPPRGDYYTYPTTSDYTPQAADIQDARLTLPEQSGYYPTFGDRTSLPGSPRYDRTQGAYPSFEPDMEAHYTRGDSQDQPAEKNDDHNKANYFVRLAQAKVVLLGSVGAGKTSLLNALRYGEPRLAADGPDGRTIGIEVHSVALKPDTKLWFYDFGGHDTYHFSQQLFLTQRVIYLLTVDVSLYDPATFDKTLRHWYTILTSRLVGPVICLLATHIDECKDRSELDRRCRDMHERLVAIEDAQKRRLEQELQALKREVAADSPTDEQLAVRRFQPRTLRQPMQRLGLLLANRPRVFPHVCCISSKTYEGMEQFRESLISIVADNESLFPQKDVPRSWIALSDSIISKKQDVPFVTMAEFTELAQHFSVVGDYVHKALAYLQSVGLVLHYQDYRQNSDLSQYVFVNPNLLLAIFGLVFNHNYFQDETRFVWKHQSILRLPHFDFVHLRRNLKERGVIGEKLLKCFWDAMGISDEVYQAIVPLLEKFDLCYEIRMRPGEAVVEGRHFLFPYLLNKRKPQEVDFMWSNDLLENFMQCGVELSFTQPSLPFGFLEKVLIRAHTYVDHCLSWKKGMVAFSDEGQDLVRLEARTDVSGNAVLTLSARVRVDRKSMARHILLLLVAVTNRVLLHHYPGVVAYWYCQCAHCLFAALDKRSLEVPVDRFPADNIVYTSPTDPTRVQCINCDPGQSLPLDEVFPKETDETHGTKRLMTEPCCRALKASGAALVKHMNYRDVMNALLRKQLLTVKQAETIGSRSNHEERAQQLLAFLPHGDQKAFDVLCSELKQSDDTAWLAEELLARAAGRNAKPDADMSFGSSFLRGGSSRGWRGSQGSQGSTSSIATWSSFGSRSSYSSTGSYFRRPYGSYMTRESVRSYGGTPASTPQEVRREQPQAPTSAYQERSPSTSHWGGTYDTRVPDAKIPSEQDTGQAHQTAAPPTQGVRGGPYHEAKYADRSLEVPAVRSTSEITKQEYTPPEQGVQSAAETCEVPIPVQPYATVGNDSGNLRVELPQKGEAQPTSEQFDAAVTASIQQQIVTEKRKKRSKKHAETDEDGKRLKRRNKKEKKAKKRLSNINEIPQQEIFEQGESGYLDEEPDVAPVINEPIIPVKRQQEESSTPFAVVGIMADMQDNLQPVVQHVPMAARDGRSQHPTTENLAIVGRESSPTPPMKVVMDVQHEISPPSATNDTSVSPNLSIPPPTSKITTSLIEEPHLPDKQTSTAAEHQIIPSVDKDVSEPLGPRSSPPVPEEVKEAVSEVIRVKKIPNLESAIILTETLEEGASEPTTAKDVPDDGDNPDLITEKSVKEKRKSDKRKKQRKKPGRQKKKETLEPKVSSVQLQESPEWPEQETQVKHEHREVDLFQKASELQLSLEKQILQDTEPKQVEFDYKETDLDAPPETSVPPRDSRVKSTGDIRRQVDKDIPGREGPHSRSPVRWTSTSSTPTDPVGRGFQEAGLAKSRSAADLIGSADLGPTHVLQDMDPIALPVRPIKRSRSSNFSFRRSRSKSPKEVREPEDRHTWAVPYDWEQHNSCDSLNRAGGSSVQRTRRVSGGFIFANSEQDVRREGRKKHLSTPAAAPSRVSSQPVLSHSEETRSSMPVYKPPGRREISNPVIRKDISAVQAPVQQETFEASQSAPVQRRTAGPTGKPPMPGPSHNIALPRPRPKKSNQETALQANKPDGQPIHEMLDRRNAPVQHAQQPTPANTLQPSGMHKRKLLQTAGQSDSSEATESFHTARIGSDDSDNATITSNMSELTFDSFHTTRSQNPSLASRALSHGSHISERTLGSYHTVQEGSTASDFPDDATITSDISELTVDSFHTFTSGATPQTRSLASPNTADMSALSQMSEVTIDSFKSCTLSDDEVTLTSKGSNSSPLPFAIDDTPNKMPLNKRVDPSLTQAHFAAGKGGGIQKAPSVPPREGPVLPPRGPPPVRPPTGGKSQFTIPQGEENAPPVPPRRDLRPEPPPLPARPPNASQMLDANADLRPARSVRFADGYDTNGALKIGAPTSLVKEAKTVSLPRTNTMDPGAEVDVPGSSSVHVHHQVPMPSTAASLEVTTPVVEEGVLRTSSEEKVAKKLKKKKKKEKGSKKKSSKEAGSAVVADGSIDKQKKSGRTADYPEEWRQDERPAYPTAYHPADMAQRNANGLRQELLGSHAEVPRSVDQPYVYTVRAGSQPYPQHMQVDQGRAVEVSSAQGYHPAADRSKPHAYVQPYSHAAGAWPFNNNNANIATQGAGKGLKEDSYAFKGANTAVFTEDPRPSNRGASANAAPYQARLTVESREARSQFVPQQRGASDQTFPIPYRMHTTSQAGDVGPRNGRRQQAEVPSDGSRVRQLPSGSREAAV